MMNIVGNQIIHEAADHYGWKEGCLLYTSYKDMVSSKQHMTKETGMFMLRPINVSPHKNHEFDARCV